MRRLKRYAALVGAVLVILLPSGVARADTVVEDVLVGYDISWPQCGYSLPEGPVGFSVIGVNGGRPFTANPCFSEQYRWATGVQTHPAVYINLEFPKAGRVEAANGPYGWCAETDGWCRGYNYGYAAGHDAFARVSAAKLNPSVWWLDVETANAWSGDPGNNSQVVRGAIDALKEHSVTLGVYSTPYQWRSLVGAYEVKLPVWNAGAQGVADAASRCGDPSFAFGGGTVQMVQYYDYGFDTNYLCPGSDLWVHVEAVDRAGDGPAGRTASVNGIPLNFWRFLPLVSQ